MSVSKLLGFDEFAADMKQARTQMAKEVKAIVTPRGKDLFKRAKEETPVSKSGTRGKPSGELKRSLVLGLEKTKQGKTVYDVKLARRETGKALAPNGVPYGAYVNYGRKKGNKGIVEPRPFLSTALEENYTADKKDIEDKMTETVEKHFKTRRF